MRLSVVKPLPFCQRSSELPPERPPHQQGGRGGGAASPVRRATVRHAPSTLAGPWKSGHRPDHLLSVVTSMPRTSCTHALDRRARRSICLTVPAGTRRTKRAARTSVDGRREAARRCVVRAPASARAPSGITPWSTKRHSAITSFRATATIPIRRLRPPAAAKRCLNQTASALSGCQRSQHHASWMLMRRNSARPALLIP